MAEQLGTTEKELIENRVDKLKAIKAKNIDPYPAVCDRDHLIGEIIERQKDLIGSKKSVVVAGRVMAKRGHGQLAFLDLADESGKIQAVIKSDIISVDEFGLVELIEVGDFVEVSGMVFETKSGELSIEVKKLAILVKATRFLPEKWHGLKDIETRYRERYVDLIVNPGVKEKFYQRSKIISALRTFLVNNGFLEVDTPVLQPIPGGASAKPFATHYNAYNAEVYLRIAPELYLKKLVVGGFEKVFEFARCFRNEGVDATHNPEFTNLEFYWAYSDYEKLMDFTEELIRAVVSEVNAGKLVMEIDGQAIDFGQKFKRMTFHDLTNGKETDEAFKAGIHKIVAPTFVMNHPTSLLPLAKRNVKNADVVDSFQLVLAGLEIAKAFSELNDPLDQRARFEEQAQLREGGDEEAQRLDEDFLKAIEYGMPPTAGWGMGVDRFIRILTDSQTLREILFFPFMKPNQPEAGKSEAQSPKSLREPEGSSEPRTA